MIEPWFRIQCLDPELDADPVVREWLDSCTQHILEEVPVPPVIKVGGFTMIVRLTDDAELQR